MLILFFVFVFDNIAVVFPPKVEEPKQRSKKVKQEEEEKKKNEPTMILNKFGTIDKNEGVQKLCFGELDGKRHVRFFQPL